MFFDRKKPDLPLRPPRPATCDVFGDVPRGADHPEIDWGKPKAEMPGAKFMPPRDILADPNMHFDGTKVFLGVLGQRVEKRQGRHGQDEFHVLGGSPVGIADDRHIIEVAGSRGGKGRSHVIPTLLTYEGSCVATDPKGELATTTAKARRDKLGQSVRVVDPFETSRGAAEKHRARFNPLSLLTYDPDDPAFSNPTIVEDAELIADGMVIPSGGDSHWDDAARQWLHGLILHVATWPFYFASRHLVTVRELLMRGAENPANGEFSFDLLRSEMQRNPACGGVVQDAAADFFDKPDNERGSVLSTARKHTHFLTYPSIQQSVTGHDFDLSDLKRRKTTVYLCLPAVRLGSCNRWLRMFVNLTLAVLEREPTPPGPPVLLCLDEFPILGHMKTIEDAAGQIAGFGVKLWPIIQDLGQLKSLYKDRWQTFMGNAGVLIFHSNNDVFTLEFISKRIGMTALDAENKSQINAASAVSSGLSGRSWSVQTQPLMTLDEIALFFGRDDPLQRELIVWASHPPVILQRAKYDSHELFGGLTDE